MRELRCRGCRRLVGYTSRPQPVPVQCPDPFCALEPAPTSNEVRDSFMEHLWRVTGKTPNELAELYKMSRQGVNRVLLAR